MQTPTVFQFQAAFLGVVRAMPMADAILQQGLVRWLAPSTVADEHIMQGLAPAEQMLYCLPALFLVGGQARDQGGETFGAVYPAIDADLMLLQDVITVMLLHPANPADHHSLCQVLGQVLGQALGQVLVPPANLASWPTGVKPSLAAMPTQDIPSMTDIATPVTTALAALLIGSESAPLTVRLAQVIAHRHHRTDSALSGAIAGLLAGLYHGQPYRPKTSSEQRLHRLSLKLFAAWAGVETSDSPLRSVISRIV